MDRWPRIYTAGEGDGCVDTEIDMGRHLASDRQQTMTSKERREERMERSGSSWREGQHSPYNSIEKG